MKILYHHRIASRDGGSTHIEEMIKAFRGLGHTVSIAAPSPGAEGGAGSGGGLVAWLKSHLPRALYEVMEFGYSAVAYRRLAALIRRERPDFIYERYNMLLLAGVWASRKFGIPLVQEVNAPFALERIEYGGLALPRFARWAERYVWSNSDAVLPVSNVLAEHVRAEGVAADKVHVIPNGIDPAAFADLPGREEAKARAGLQGRLVIGFTGFVRDWDRLDRVVKWMAGYSGPENLHLLIVGDGPARESIESCAALHGVTERVSFTGVVARDGVARAARAFDVALQTNLVPYISPLCLFEYLALAVAIVAPDQPNHHEILEHGRSAMLYDTKDPAGLEKSIEALVSNEALRESIAAAGPSVIREKRLTWRDNATTVCDIVRTISP